MSVELQQVTHANICNVSGIEAMISPNAIGKCDSAAVSAKCLPDKHSL